MKILSVVGARPQFVKLAPVAEALSEAGHQHVIVHTGQHYDTAMSDTFFADLQIPDPDIQLGVGSGSHAVQTGAILAALEPALIAEHPDAVLVYGDTNSTLAGALAAVKIHLPTVHLEAGLRSFNRRMPEEHNRILTDHAADLLLAPTEVAMGHLRAEGLSENSVLVGDVMADVCLRVAAAAATMSFDLPRGLVAGEFVAATIHRPDNTDDPQRLESILEALAGSGRPVWLLTHPRLQARAQSHGLRLDRGDIHVGAPLPYAQMLRAMIDSAAVVTDSGGLQKEAFLLGRPCTTLRHETEWVETLQGGWNVLATDLTRLAHNIARPAPSAPRGRPFGTGAAARAAVAAIADHLGTTASRISGSRIPG